MATSGYIITEQRDWHYAAWQLETKSTLDTTTDTVTVTVRQDIDADGATDNEQQVELSGGEETFPLSGFEAVDGGSDYWIRVDMSTDGGDPQVDYAVLTPPENIISGEIADSDGTLLPGAEVEATEMTTGETYRGFTNENGFYELEVPAGLYNVTAYYEYDGTEYATDSQPFISVEGADTL